MDRSLIHISKFLSLVLRHRPETLGLTLDEHGWANIDVLLEAARAIGKPITRELLLRVVRENDKQRFAISEDGASIRAKQGHSIDVDLGLEPVRPPDILYNGTVQRFLTSIAESGLLPGNRQYVHLSPDSTTARSVGQRRGRPVILEVLAGQMHEDGFLFYLSENGVWLTDRVPARYILFP